MQVAQSGEDWKRQIGKELGAKGYPTPPSESREPNLSTSTSHDQVASSSCRAGPNADRSKGLLEGSEFHCGERKEDRYGRVTLRGSLFIVVPRHADFSNVWIQCNLLKKGLLRHIKHWVGVHSLNSMGTARFAYRSLLFINIKLFLVNGSLDEGKIM